MYNILLCSAGKRVKLIKQLKESLKNRGLVIVTDYDKNTPAMYAADKSYAVPKITDQKYIEMLIEICKKENIKAITTLIDPEIEILSKADSLFNKNGVLMLVPSYKTAKLCMDKYAMYEYLNENNINTIKSYINLELFYEDFHEGLIGFPCFIKPRFGSGSFGARIVYSKKELEFYFSYDSMIIQEFMEGVDINVDIYVDCYSLEIISLFAKQKLQSKIGGACRVLSYKDNRLDEFIRKINKIFEFHGPADIDLFYQNGSYFITEINPRFGGGYIYAHALNVDFTPLIIKNIEKKVNSIKVHQYKENLLMMMYDEILIKNHSCTINPVVDAKLDP